MVAGLDVLGGAASVLQIVGMICSLGNRILDKPKDTKALDSISADAEKYIQYLTKWETELSGLPKQASRDLCVQLEAIIHDIGLLKGKKRLAKARTCLKLYKAEFRERFKVSIEEFRFTMCAESKRSADAMDDKLGQMTKTMERLRVTSETLERLPGVGDTIATVNAEILKMSREITELSKAISEAKLAIRRLETQNITVSQIEKIISEDGNDTRQCLHKLGQQLDEVDDRLRLNESAIRIRAEFLPMSSGLSWYEKSPEDRHLKIWALDEVVAENDPPATLNGLDLATTRLGITYDEVLTKRHIADDVDEDIREKKRRRLDNITPYVSLVKRGEHVEELHEYVPSSVIRRFEEELPEESQATAIGIVRTLSQEYRYSVLDRILKTRIHTLPALFRFVELERAMLALHSEKLRANLGFVFRDVFEGCQCTCELRITVSRFFPNLWFGYNMF